MVDSSTVSETQTTPLGTMQVQIRTNAVIDEAGTVRTSTTGNVNVLVEVLSRGRLLASTTVLFGVVAPMY
ncbi:MAG: hypothetical protein M3198_19910 [Actinomycetota bacterium]|nr:hypothetical protein [Actinomycetota bacterium]